MSDGRIEWEPVLRKEAERRLMEKLRKVAMEGCTEEIRAFAECARGKTVSVAWKCREPSGLARACMDTFKQDEKLKADMRRAHAEEFPRSVTRWERVAPESEATSKEKE